MAVRAVSQLHGKTVDGVAWFVMTHLKREARRKKLEAEFKEKREGWKKRNMIIKNLPQTMTETMLHQLCDEYGEIESLKIHMTENITYQGDQKVPQMVSNGSAFVCYSSEDSARKAFISLRNKMIEGKNIFVAMWKPREELVKNLNTKKYKMFSKQMMEYGAFNPMYMQQMKVGRGRAPIAQVMPQMIPPMIPQPVHRPMPVEPQNNRLGFDLNVFQNATHENQKRMLGEQLYPFILKNSNDKVAGKITGMLLEIDHRNLIVLLQNQNDLKNKVREAIEVLRNAWANNPKMLETLPD
jgi:polyadenylate-binding protein